MMLRPLKMFRVATLLCAIVAFSAVNTGNVAQAFVARTSMPRGSVQLSSATLSPPVATKKKSTIPRKNSNASENNTVGGAKKRRSVTKKKGNAQSKAKKSSSKLSRKEQNSRYMMKRWKSQSLQKKLRKEKQDIENKSISVVGLTVDDIFASGSSNNKDKKQNDKRKKKTQNNKSRKTIVKGESTSSPSNEKKNLRRGNKSPSARRTKTASKGKNNKRRQSKSKQKQRLSWMELSPGSLVSGKVRKVLPYGALVQTPYDIPGKTPGCAILHISQISNEKIEDVSKVLKPGQEIKDARVVSLNREAGKVSISLRKQTQRAISLETLHEGDEVEGKVVRMKKYGVFVDVGCKRNALLHISRMSLHKVEDMTDHVNIGDTVKVRVLRVDADQKNIAVSMLSPENDKFVDRRDMQRKRMSLWQQIVAAEDDDLQDTKTQLLELDRAIWDDFQASMNGPPRSLEV